MIIFQNIDWLYWIFIFLSGFYLIIILLVLIGLSRLRLKTCSRCPSISVVIAARNEEKRVEPTLQSLEKLNYPQESYEIILVDDASTDRTPEIIQSYVERHNNWKLIRLEEKSGELRGKKKALKSAIALAKGEIIFTTDADCRVSPNWLKVMSYYFDEQTAMVIGHSPLQTGKGFFNALLNFDNLFSAIVGAAPAKLGFPLTSVGRNLAYRKSAYEQIGGFEALKKFKSGDDVHLTELFRTQAKGKIDYCAHPESFVQTKPPLTGKEIFQQQIRKNSKTLNKSLPSVIFSILLFASYLLLLIFPLFNAAWLGLWAKVMAAKFIGEFIALFHAAVIFRKKEIIPYLPIMLLVYPVYIIFFSLLGSLQIYQWKK